jgi:hypothetical protein
MQSIQLATWDVEGLRARLRKMSDKELREFGKAARYMLSPKANMVPVAAAQKRLILRISRTETETVDDLFLRVSQLPRSTVFNGDYVPPSTCWHYAPSRFNERLVFVKAAVVAPKKKAA